LNLVFVKNGRSKQAAPLDREGATILRKGEPMAGSLLRTRVESVSLPKPPEQASVGSRWRFRRNLVIVIAHRNGVSQRMLADVFDLPHSRIAAIVKEFRSKYEHADSI
jgi:hypothetical protein